MEIKLIFTRDFSLAMTELWHSLLSGNVKKEFGAGIENQLSYYNGRTSEFYRRVDELSAMKKSICNKSAADYLFSPERKEQFNKDVDAVRHLMEQPFINDKSRRAKHFAEIFDAFGRLYPVYMLGVFLPNVWKDDFIKSHISLGQAIVDSAYDNRVCSEGLLKEVDTYARLACEVLLKDLGFSAEFAKLLLFNEMTALFAGLKPCGQDELIKRSKGYILYGRILNVEEDLDKFLENNNLEFTSQIPDSVNEIAGQIASKGGLVKGRVQVIMNSFEVKKFIKGNILVTPMTSPEYVSAMKSASAIITDEGGLTCHAAIVSRELGVPCIIGTKVATKILKDGDLVEANCASGQVKIL